MSGYFVLTSEETDRATVRTDEVAGHDARIAIGVDCESGFGGEETPVRFRICQRSREVTEILDRWLVPDNYNFKVRGDDGGLYVLRHVFSTDDWELVLYAGGAC